MIRVTTRERGTIPSCRPAGPNTGLFPHDPTTDARTDAYLAQLRADHDRWQALYARLKADRDR